MKRLTGRKYLVEEVKFHLRSGGQHKNIEGRVPSITTKREYFAPVLVAHQVKCHKPQRYNYDDKDLAFARDLLGILEKIEKGVITETSHLRDALNFSASSGKVPFAKIVEDAFDLMYGALQLVAWYIGSIHEQNYHELFKTTVGLVYPLAGGIGGKSFDFAANVDHFLAHAAVFLSAADSTTPWNIIVQNASLRLEEWGLVTPPKGILIHAAHNLEILSHNLPDSDLSYDIVKHLRKKVKEGHIEASDAFDVFSLAIGWREAHQIVRILWKDHYPAYVRHEIALMNSCFQTCGDDEAVRVAKKRTFQSDSGIPYIRSERPLTADGEFVISFPGGWSIGRTSTLCKTDNQRLLLDFGSDHFGRVPSESVDLHMLDAVFISHAHQDHIGGLLHLYGQGLYSGRWYATKETRDLSELALLDTVHLRYLEHGGNAVFNESTVRKVIQSCEVVRTGEFISLNKKVKVKALGAGHVCGACQWLISNSGKNLLFSGDINTRKCLSVPALEYPSDEEVSNTIGVIVEGTYVVKDEIILDPEQAKLQLLEEIKKSVSQPVLLPSLSLGRAQELCAILAGTNLRVGVFGLAAKMTKLAGQSHGNNINFDQRRLQDVTRLDYDVIVASSGSLEGGPSRYFFEREDWKPISVILTGYLFPDTYAHENASKFPRVRFSAHVPKKEWVKYIQKFPKAQIFLTHIPTWPSELPGKNIIIPRSHTEYRVKSDQGRSS